MSVILNKVKNLDMLKQNLCDEPFRLNQELLRSPGSLRMTAYDRV